MISRVNPSSFGTGDKFTSSQANAMDTNATYAADKRAGQTDTLGALWQFSGIGRAVPSFVAGANANTTYEADGGNTMISVTTLSSSVTYSLSQTNGVPGDMISIANYTASNKSVTVVDAGTSTQLAILGSQTFPLGANLVSADFIFGLDSVWRLWRQGASAALVPVILTASGSFFGLPGVTSMLVLASGGGGGGGGAPTSGPAAASLWDCGGGGGGGAVMCINRIVVSAGTQYDAVIGAGGAGGSTGGPIGSFGTPTTVAIHSGATLLTAPGAGGGIIANFHGNAHAITPGGAPTGATQTVTTWNTGAAADAIASCLARIPGEGGFSFNIGTATNASAAGCTSAQGYAGGAAGATGAVSGSFVGGSGGGGGGGGAFGVGGAGGGGGPGNSGGVGGSGFAGTAAAANTGAGGGGGGAAGGGTSAGGGAAGAAGGSGIFIAIPLR